MPEGFFDFKQIDEEKDDLDYNNLIDCPHCKKPIAGDAIICYFCGKSVDLSKKTGCWPGLAAALVVLLIIYLIFF